MNLVELNELIIHYLTESKLKNAILINGAWGSGKTYYIQNDLMQKIKNTKTSAKKPLIPIYISLYGIENLSDISKELFNKTIFFGKNMNFSFKSGRRVGSKGRKKYAWEVAKGTTKALVKGLITKYLGMEFTFPQISDYWPYLDGTEVVLLLDDIERSRIEIVELLGFINNFVEEYSIKTILIGNEEEIKSRFLSENIVLKYELVKNLELPIEEKENGQPKLGFGNLPEKTPLISNGVIKTDIDTLNKQINYLFPNPSNYETIKEKLIGFTVDFTPDLPEIFSKLSNEKMDEGTAIRVSNIFTNYHCNNIRTFQFGLEMLDKVNKLIEKLGLKNKKEVTNQVIDSIFFLSIIIKDPRLAPIRSDSDFDFSFENGLSKETNQLFKSEVGKFLDTSIIYFEKMEKILSDIDKELTNHKAQESTGQNNPLKELQTHWINLEDDDLKGRMVRTIQGINNNPIDINIYKQLIHFGYFYNEIFKNEEMDVPKIADDLIAKIASVDKEIPNDGFFHSSITFSNKDIIDEINKLFSKIDVEVKKHNEQIMEKTGKDNSQSKNWVKEIVISINKHGLSSKGEKKSIIGYLNIPSILDNIGKCNIDDLNCFFYDILQKVYNFGNIGEFYSGDLPAIEELNNGLSKIRSDFSDIEGKKIFSFVLSQIEEYLSKTIIPKLQNRKEM